MAIYAFYIWGSFFTYIAKVITSLALLMLSVLEINKLGSRVSKSLYNLPLLSFTYTF